ncbi:MAG: hypothetical protein J1E00_00660 [Oscillospiraceae bacterium]|nr:hypothetical protein [Oscillospiraceae bacterium]
MKKHLRTLVCVLLLLSMIAVLAACGDSNDDATDSGNSTTSNGGNSSDSSDTSKEEDPSAEYIVDGRYVPKVGVLDEFKGRSFNILVVGDGGTYQSDDFTTEQGEGGIDYGDNYYDAVRNRNNLVEEKYEVELIISKEQNAAGLASQDAVAGTMMYDAVVLNVGNMTTLARDGYLCDLNAMSDYIDLNAPWWDEDANTAFSIGDKLFFATGDITIMNKANTWSILFNKQMIVDHQLESPYTLFNEGKWTFDKMVEMCQTVSNATVTSEWDDNSVTYGMVAALGDPMQFYGASGQLLCEKDAANEPSLKFGMDEASVNLAVRILDVFNDAAWKVYGEDCTGGPRGNVWDDSFAIFYGGRALFRPSGFTAVAKMRSLSEIEFGIVPMPKMTEEQDDHFVVANSGFAAGILKGCADENFSAYMLDALASAAKYDSTGGITYEYLETTLMGKNYMDNDSREMVAYIFNHIKYDVGRIYGFGGVNNIMYGLAKDKSSDVRSSFDSIYDTIESAIEETVADYEANT